MIDVSVPVFIFILALIGVILFLLGIRIGQRRSLDPLVPHNIPFRDREDFLDRVAWPMVMIEDEDRVPELMKLYNQASPYFICVSMVMLDNALAKMAQDHPN